MDKKLALVTGGTRGIGRSIVLELLKRNYQIITTYSSNEEAAEKLVNEDLKEFNKNEYLVLKSDVSSIVDIDLLLKKSYDKFKMNITHLVNNAGILKQGDFFCLSESQWDRTMAVNLKGPFLLTQKVMSKMLNGGSIVNIVSIGGQTGGSKAPDYAASKAALTCFSQSMANIGSKMGIRVNAVSPGWIDTGIFSEERYEEIKIEAKEKIPLERLGKPEEVANAVCFLLSEDASYITAQVLNVNGGMYF